MSSLSDAVVIGSRQRVCEKLVLDNPEETLSKTPEEIAAVTRTLQAGTLMMKHCRKSKPKTRLIRVSPEGDGVTWNSKRGDHRIIPFSCIVRVQRGRHTSTFHRARSSSMSSPSVAATSPDLAADADQRISFSIICDEHAPDGRQSLDLVAPSQEVCDAWVTGLQLLIFAQRVGVYDGDLKLLRRAFDRAPQHKPGRLTYDQVKHMLRDLNVGVTKSTLRPIFERVCVVDDTGTSLCDLDAVIRIVETVRDRPDVRSLFRALLQYQATHEEGGEATPVAVVAGPGDGGDVASVTGDWETPTPGQEELAEVPLGALPEGAEFVNGLFAETVLYFMHTYQCETDATIRDVFNIMHYFQQEPLKPGVVPLLYLPGFTAYLTSTANTAFAPERAERYQDMSRPLTDYYIFTSHNTYLEGDQLSSNSSVNMYINALTSGCRCVELDCWDGVDGEPIIYHGRTLTSKILFVDVIKAIREFGFKSNPYPVILSLEVHCCPAQQDRMAAILRAELGDMLLLPPAGVVRPRTEPLPSPAELVYRVIVKGKTSTSKHYGRPKDPLGPREQPAPPPPTLPMSPPRPPGDGTPTVPPLHLTTPPPATPTDHVEGDGGTRVVGASAREEMGIAFVGAAIPPPRAPVDVGCFPSMKRAAVTTDAAATPVGTEPDIVIALDGVVPVTSAGLPPPVPVTSTKDKSHPVTAALSEVIYIQAVKFAGFDVAEMYGAPWRMSSVKEPKADVLVRKNPKEFLQYTSHAMMRVYPGPLRVDSSNYNPSLFWAVGCQMVALNLQTPGVPTQLNQARFRQNGRCGYVLKPELSLGVLEKHLKWGGFKKPQKPHQLNDTTPVVPPRRGSVDMSASTPVRGLASVMLALDAAGLSARVTPHRGPTDVDGDDPDDASDGTAEDDRDTVTTGGTSSIAGSGSVASSSITSGIADQMSVGPEMTYDHPQRSNRVVLPVFAGAEAAAGDVSRVPGSTYRKKYTSTSVEGSFMRTILAHIRSPLVRMESPVSEFQITLMGGQNLPTLDSGGVVSPYCIVSIHGHPADKTRMRSSTVFNNGLNPVWMQKFEFVVQHPGVAMLHIGVYHQVDIGRDVQIAHFAAPIDVLRQGYRSCSLRAKSGKRIPFCNLLCLFAARPF